MGRSRLADGGVPSRLMCLLRVWPNVGGYRAAFFCGLRSGPKRRLVQLDGAVIAAEAFQTGDDVT